MIDSVIRDLDRGHEFRFSGQDRYCVHCGLPMPELYAPRLDRAMKPVPDGRRDHCPGPHSNVVGVSLVLAANKLARQLHWDRPLKGH